MYSFVVDWFIDISAGLSQFTEVPAFVAQRFVTVSVKSISEETVYPSIFGAHQRVDNAGILTVINCQHSASIKRTESYTADTYPGIPGHLPRWNPKLNKRKILDILLFLRNFASSRR